VRVACLGGDSGGTKLPGTDKFELKRAVCDLSDELARLGYGTVVRLEFKRGLPCRLETTPQLLFGFDPRRAYRRSICLPALLSEKPLPDARSQTTLTVGAFCSASVC
jgi:hypothetical protein